MRANSRQHTHRAENGSVSSQAERARALCSPAGPWYFALFPLHLLHDDFSHLGASSPALLLVCPLTHEALQAIATRFAYERQSGTRVYNGAVSKTWTIGAVPHGGYILSLALTAALQRQRELDSPHLDPAHLHADFLTPSSVGALQVSSYCTSCSRRAVVADPRRSRLVSSLPLHFTSV